MPPNFSVIIAPFQCFMVNMELGQRTWQPISMFGDTAKAPFVPLIVGQEPFNALFTAI